MRSAVSLTELMDARLLRPNESLTAMSKGKSFEARLLPDGRIEDKASGAVFTSLSVAANALTGAHTNGWRFWHVKRGGARVPLTQVRDQLSG